MSWTWLGLAAAGMVAIACIAGYRRGFVKEIVSTFFVILSFFMVWLINPYVNTFIREKTSVYETIQTEAQKYIGGQIEDKTAATQREIIESLELPELLKESIVKNNTAETYRYLAVDSFTEYISEAVAAMVLNGLTFLISFMISNLVIRIAALILELIAGMPVISGVNRATGAVVGGVKSILFIWVIMLVLTILCETEIGQEAMKLVENDTILKYLYDRNVIVKIFMDVFQVK